MKKSPKQLCNEYRFLLNYRKKDALKEGYNKNKKNKLEVETVNVCFVIDQEEVPELG